MKNSIIKNLIEIKDLLSGLSEEKYNQKLEILSNASIGQHVRHIIEFYQCLFSANKTKEVNYDLRNRDLRIETDLLFAQHSIDVIINELLEVKKDFSVAFIANYSFDNDHKTEIIQSTFYRELAYNLEHSIHHQALIKVAITELKLTNLVNDTFGFAPSTIRNTTLCAQ